MPCYNVILWNWLCSKNTSSLRQRHLLKETSSKRANLQANLCKRVSVEISETTKKQLESTEKESKSEGMYITASGNIFLKLIVAP